MGRHVATLAMLLVLATEASAALDGRLVEVEPTA